MTRIVTDQEIYQKGQTPAKKPRKPMRKVRPSRGAGKDPRDCMFVSEVLRSFAKGKECQMKSEWCDCDPEKVALCHGRRRSGTGMSQKPHDFWAYHGCSSCHANEHRLEDRELYDAIRRTQWVVFQKFGTLTP